MARDSKPRARVGLRERFGCQRRQGVATTVTVSIAGGSRVATTVTVSIAAVSTIWWTVTVGDWRERVTRGALIALRR